MSHDPAPAALPSGPVRLAGVGLDERRAIVVGASSGMGAALVRQLAGEGYRVAALARRKPELDALAAACAPACAATGGAVISAVHDAANLAEVPALFERLVRELGGLDLFVYAAGVMPKIGKEQYDTALDREILAVNLDGAIAWGNECANYMRTRRRGTIVGISSIAGDRGRKGNPVYCTSKAALNTYLEALRNRLSESGVHVCTIKPGYVDTRMTQGLDKLFWLISAEEAARQILAAARNRVNTRYVPLRWQAVGTVLKLVPSFLFRRASI
ncbi:MAG: SDR family NAD(P)-dependent oxidoreductase [Planctomycetes bacterium]|nr:SDR family NAD(P)-dependent oxidoreductase [Planctomycetota bacterium]